MGLTRDKKYVDMKRKQMDIYVCTKKFEQWFSKQPRLAFFSALLIGFVTHYWFLVNLFMSPDGIVYSVLYSAGDFEISVGRWGIDLIDSIRANRSVSSVSSIGCLFLAAFGCALLTDVLQLKKRVSVILTSAAIMVSPALTLTLLYEYCSDAYLCGFFLSVLSVFCVHRMKHNAMGIGMSAVCLCGALSIYQNYIGVMIGCCLIILIKELFNKQLLIADIIRDGIKRLAAIAAGGILYYGMTRAICAIKGIAPSTYNGAASINMLSVLSSLGTSSIESIRKIKHFFLHDTYVFNIKWYRDRMCMIFFAILILCIVALVMQKQLYRDKVRILLMLLCLGLLPLGLNAVFIIAPDSELYALNSMQLMLVFPLLFCLAEEFELGTYICMKWSGLAVSAAILFTYYTAANYSYSYLELSYNQARAEADKIVDRMQSTVGYERGMPCAIAGILTDEYFPRDRAYRGYTICNIVEGPIFHGNYAGSRESWKKFCLIYQGEDLNFCDPVRYQEIVESEEFKKIGVFPAESSVKIIQNVVVAKLMEEVPVL